MAKAGAGKAAKIESGGKPRVVLTRHACMHCGDPIMSDAVQTVKVIEFNDQGGRRSRMEYYTRGHRN